MRSSRYPIGAGFTARQGGFEVRVLEAPDGHPTKLRDTSLEPVELVEWRDGRLRHFQLPALGESRELPHDATPFDFISKLLR